MHGADTYRNAVGESGRQRQREMTRNSVEASQTLLFPERATTDASPPAGGLALSPSGPASWRTTYPAARG